LRIVMATPEAQASGTERAFERLADRGYEWLSFDQVAIQAMINDRDRRRYQRSRLVNSIRDLLAADRRPSRPSIPYTQQTELGMAKLDSEGRLERRFVGSGGELLEHPVLPPSFEDVRFKLLPAEAIETVEPASPSAEITAEPVLVPIDSAPALLPPQPGQYAA
jgi:hypothetical protein